MHFFDIITGESANLEEKVRFCAYQLVQFIADTVFPLSCLGSTWNEFLTILGFLILPLLITESLGRSSVQKLITNSELLCVMNDIPS
jgi:hypothetical protein